MTNDVSSVWMLIFWASLSLSLAIGFIYFRDLGDVTQMLMRVKRENMLRFIRHENQLLGVGLCSALIAVYAHFGQGAGGPLVFWPAMFVLLVFYGFTWVWVHLGLRHQRKTAKFYSIDEAKKYVSPATSVIVLENNGEARAHPDYEMWRPHLVGDEKGLGGENVILTYCSMTNLGHGYKPEIGGQELDLEVLAQHGNNLIMRDNCTGEPIQQMYGNRERDGRDGPRMEEWPTFRMSFRGFQKAFPDGQVFLNRPSKNPFLWLVDFAVNTSFSLGLAKHNREEKPVMDNMSYYDDRLPNKTHIWGFNVGSDYVCYTEDFIHEQGDLINVSVGGRDIVVAYDSIYESVGVYYNDSGNPVQQIDFFGESDQGKLPRVETVKAGMFWHVWIEFNRDTDINRAGTAIASAA
jgi:hypothetical protein